MLSFLRRRPPAPEPAEPSADAPADDVVAEAPARPCPTCGAALTADQDWCHECGAAQPGRIGERPGWRAAATVAGLTLALVGGAGVASYAAITQDPAPPPATQAQAPPATTAPPATPAPGTTAPAPGTDPTVPTPSPSQDEPSEEVPGDSGSGSSSSGSSSGGSTESSGSSGRSSGSSGSSSGSTGSSSGSLGTGSTGSGTSGSTGTTTPSTTSPNTTTSPDTTATSPDTTTTTPDPTDDDPRPYDLPPGAVTVYDPDDRDGAIGAPGLAADGDDKTGWVVELPPDGRPAGVGLLIDLDAPREVTSVNVETSTPGFDVEVYGAESGIPRRITSDGWQHIADAQTVDRSERIPLTDAEGEIRRIVVWITNVPAADRRAVIDEVVVRVRPS